VQRAALRVDEDSFEAAVVCDADRRRAGRWEDVSVRRFLGRTAGSDDQDADR
jgi:hypothetical protein